MMCLWKGRLICLREMQRKFHAWRQNKGETGARGTVQPLFLVVQQMGSQSVLVQALHKIQTTAANLPFWNGGPWNRSGKCWWRYQKGAANGLAGHWFCPKCPPRHLVHAKRSLIFGPVEKVHPYENIPRFKQPVTFIFNVGLQDLNIKTTIRLSWSNDCVVAILPVISLLASVAEDHGTWG